MRPLSHKEIQEFKSLWNRTNPRKISEKEAEHEANKLLNLVSLIIKHPAKNYEK